jgi:pilus assembly protein Flp/PilA
MMNSGVRTFLLRLRWRAAVSVLADDTGATAMEYGLIAALIAVAILSGLKTLGNDLVNLPLQSIITAVQSVATP